MEYENERLSDVPCINKRCQFNDATYMQNCRAEFDGNKEPYLPECLNYTPANTNNRFKRKSCLFYRLTKMLGGLLQDNTLS